MLTALIFLGISTILKAIYFMKTVIRIYTPEEKPGTFCMGIKDAPRYCVLLVFFMLLNVFLGTNSDGVVALIEQGLGMFG